jgi:glycosyltransferase involved in cell wall biosynthesis
VKGSFLASALNAISTRYHKSKGFFKLIDAFVVTNDWMLQIMVRSGYAREKLHVIPTFVDPKMFRPRDTALKEDYIAYVGRLEFHKGVHVAVEALHHFRRAGCLPMIRLKIAGNGDAGYIQSLRRQVSSLGLCDAVDFVGKLNEERLCTLLNGALVSMVTSLWYENLPNSLLESLACGTPVLAPRHGCFTACVREGETGFFFEPGSAPDLARALKLALSDRQQLLRLSAAARLEAERIYSPEQHLESLFGLFREVSARNWKRVPDKSAL